MADFCKQCSISTFGVDHRELVGLTSPEDVSNDLYCVVVCEGCGHIQVDPEGSCVSEDCRKGHSKE